ncbi:MAG: calcium/sodium antiporter [Acidimicrobiales bacterium]
MLLAIIAVGLGIAILWRAADEFVTGAARLAVVFELSPIVVGAVIIGFGTSAPEMLVSAIAAAGGDNDVGIGNIIGSNIANLSLILGAAALVIPISIGSGVLKREAPLAAGAAVLFAVLLRSGLGTVEGVILFVALAAALALLLRTSDNEELSEDVAELTQGVEIVPLTEMIRTFVGLALTVGGAWVLVWGALDLADRAGVSGGFIGVTLVAIGTSLPELVTAIAAARKGEDELIVGNLLGSNLFNALAVGGLVGLLGDGTVADSSLVGLDLVFMLVVAIGSVIAMRTRGTFTRVEGALFIGVFVLFLMLAYVGEPQDAAFAALTRR